MNKLKMAAWLLLAVQYAPIAVAGDPRQQSGVTGLYKGLEFKMPVVSEPVIPDNTVVLTDFGAVSGGGELCTNAFSKAIDALSKKGGGRLIVPRGTWFTGPITLRSNIELYTEAGALVLFSGDKDLYPLVETNFEGFNTWRCTSPLNGRNLENVAITGQGLFDGGGDAWRAVKKDKLTDSQWKKLVSSGGVVSENGKTWYPSVQFREGEKLAEMNVPRQLRTKEEFEKIRDFLRPVMVSLVSCNKVLIDGPTFQNSPAWCLHPLLCQDLTVRNTTVKNPWYSQNGDGLDIESCKNSVVYNCNFDVGDDAICIKSGKDKEGRDRGVPTENLVVKNCVVYHGHGGVTVGSEMSGGVKNMHVSNCTFVGTDVGLRFKSNRGRGGVVSNIFISRVEMINIPAQAISFDLYYGGKSVSEAMEEGGEKDQAVRNVTDETPAFRDISIRDVYCRGAYQGIFLQGLPEMNLENILLENIRMEADYGLICRDVSRLKIKNITLVTNKMPVADFVNSRTIEVDGLQFKAGSRPVIHVSGPGSGSLKITNTSFTDSSVQLIVEKEVPAEAVELQK
jgi:polygalacturonase